MKDIKTKPQGTPKITANAPKSVSRVPEAVKNIKSVAKDNLIKNTIEKRLDDNSSGQQSERAEVYATENVESAAYNAADSAYHKGKTFAENKIKQRVQQVKTKENQSAPQNTNTSEAPQSANTLEAPSNAPKATDNMPKTRETAQSDISQNAPKQRDIQSQKVQHTVKTKEEYVKSQRAVATDPDAVKTKENYIKQHKGQSELQNGIKQKPSATAPRVREPVTTTSDTQNTLNNILTKTRGNIAPDVSTPKTKAEAIKDTRKNYVSNKLKIKAETKKQLQNGVNADNSPLPKNDISPLQQKEVSAPKTKSSLSSETESMPQSKSLPKTKESYMLGQRQQKTAVLIKTPDRKLTMPKQNTHTVSRSVSGSSKKAVKTRQSVSKGRSAVKKGNAYVGKTTRKGAVKATKKAVKTQKEVTKKAAKQAAKRAKEIAQRSAQVAKATAKATVRVAVKVAQVVAAATKAIVSALAALGGWAVLLVVLIIVIIVAAIAASPFGIFISDEAADTDSIPISSIVAECNMELSTQLTNIEDSVAADRIVMGGVNRQIGMRF